MERTLADDEGLSDSGEFYLQQIMHTHIYTGNAAILPTKLRPLSADKKLQPMLDQIKRKILSCVFINLHSDRILYTGRLSKTKSVAEEASSQEDDDPSFSKRDIDLIVEDFDCSDDDEDQHASDEDVDQKDNESLPFIG